MLDVNLSYPARLLLFRVANASASTSQGASLHDDLHFEILAALASVTLKVSADPSSPSARIALLTLGKGRIYRRHNEDSPQLQKLLGRIERWLGYDWTRGCDSIQEQLLLIQKSILDRTEAAEEVHDSVTVHLAKQGWGYKFLNEVADP